MKLAILLTLTAVAMLLFGCTGVSQSDYDGLKSSCDADKQALSGSLSEEKQNSFEVSGKLNTCTSEKQETARQLAAKQQENEVLKAEAAVLNSARVKTEKIGEYNDVLTAYYEAFGPGKVANTPRLNAIELAVGRTGDGELSVLWSGVRNCQGITGCGNAKSAFTGSINASINSLALEIVGIVEGNQTG